MSSFAEADDQTEIIKRFPEFIIEDGFVENDELWKDDDRESELRMQQRGRRALDRLFGDNGAKETCKSSFYSTST
jgi:hypothetical protein